MFSLFADPLRIRTFLQILRIFLSLTAHAIRSLQTRLKASTGFAVLLSHIDIVYLAIVRVKCATEGDRHY